MPDPSRASRARYRTIVADPPWDYGNVGGFRRRKRGVKLPYPTLAIAQISALPITDLAAADAHLYLWTTNTHVEHAWAIARAWGFAPKNLLTWCKPPKGLIGYGAFSQSAEFVLFSSRGQLSAETRCNRTWFEWNRGAHSAKPDAFLDLVEQVSPGPYLELFARRQRLGWETWGDEALEHVQIEATRQ